jgi:GWxTD domain-containing protein
MIIGNKLRKQAMKTYYDLSFFLFILVLISSCATKTNVSTQNIAHVYKSSSSLLHPEYVVYHISDSVSAIYFKVAANELLYIKKDNSTTTARLNISYVIKESFESKTVLDSGSLVVSDVNSSKTNKWITGKLIVKASYGKIYLADILARDLNRAQVMKKSYLNINKSSRYDEQNFLLLTTETAVPLFRNYIDADEQVKLQYTNKEIKKIWVAYFNRNFPLPSPPFSTREFESFVYKPDSLFELTASDSSFAIHFQKQGFYHIRIDTSNKAGFTVFRFDVDFPFIKTPDNLLEPLRYLTPKNEFLTMSNYRNKKIAVDSFWIHCGGNQTKGKELIRKFYRRMQDANIYFTSYLAGWKSDRGLIYLIYGPPQYLYKTNNLETWSYDFGGTRGQSGLSYLFSFTFVKVINPFTDNDFRLDRNASYKDNWYIAVDAWRLGQVYSDY